MIRISMCFSGGIKVGGSKSSSLLSRLVQRLRGGRALKGSTGGALRAALHSDYWKGVSLRDAVKRIAGDNPIIESSSTGKIVFRNPSTGAEVVHDIGGNYFRVRNSAGIYVDESGKMIPDNVYLIKPNKITQTGVPKDVRKSLTHFNNTD